MPKGSNDRRAVHSRSVIKDAFLSLLEKKNYTDLNITDICNEAAFKKACNMTSYACSFIKDIEISDTRRYALEGYMMPGNYQLIKESSATNVVQVFLDQFSIEYTASLRQKVEESGYTLDEIVTMASMIQEECAVKTDFAIMSSMLYNRMSFRDELLNKEDVMKDFFKFVKAQPGYPNVMFGDTAAKYMMEVLKLDLGGNKSNQ